MSKQRIRFIINPKSGQKKRKNIPRLIDKFLNKEMFDYDIVFTEYRMHGAELASKAIEEKIDIVCAVGGDGSVHEIGNTLAGSEVKLAIIPRGSGNGLANHLGIPKMVRKAIETINDSAYTTMDTVKLNDHRFLGVAGIGLDAIIADKFDSHKTRGLRGYINVVMKEYFKYKSVKVKATLDGKEYPAEELFICSIANASEFGNGFCISPNSTISDGRIELFKLRKLNIFVIPFVAFRFFNRTIHKSRFAKVISFQEGTLEINQDVMHLDGEPRKIISPLKISVQPKSLHILTGKKIKDEAYKSHN